MQSNLPIEIKEVHVQGERGACTFRISSPEEDSYNIFAECKRERKQWNTAFTDFSQYAEGTHLPSHILIPIIIQALSLLSVQYNAEQELQTELLPKAEINVFNTNLLILLKIPMVSYFIIYKLPLTPVDMDETELLRLQYGDIKDVTDNLENEMKKLKDEMKELKQEVKELKATEKDLKDEMKELKNECNKLKALLFRHTFTQKEMGKNSVELKSVGFSEEDIKAWSEEELKDQGYGAPSLKLQYIDNQGAPHGCQLSNEYQSVTTLSSAQHRYITVSEPLSQDYSSFWKINIEQLKNWIAIGLIGQLQSSYISYKDKTNHSWACSQQVYIGGTNNNNYGGWNGFVSGDQVFFRYEPETKTLTMKVKRLEKNQAFTLICDGLDNAYIYVNILHQNDRITLEEMTAHEEELYFHLE